MSTMLHFATRVFSQKDTTSTFPNLGAYVTTVHLDDLSTGITSTTLSSTNLKDEVRDDAQLLGKSGPHEPFSVQVYDVDEELGGNNAKYGSKSMM